MNTQRYDSIEYEEDWQSVPTIKVESARGYSRREGTAIRDEEEYDEDVYRDEEEQGIYKTIDQEKAEKIKKAISPQLLIKLQLIACLLVAITAFGIKTIGGDLYTTARTWYQQQMQASLIILPSDIQ